MCFFTEFDLDFSTPYKIQKNLKKQLKLMQNKLFALFENTKMEDF